MNVTHKVICDGEWFEIIETETPETATDDQILTITAENIIAHHNQSRNTKFMLKNLNTPNPSLVVIDLDTDTDMTWFTLILPMMS